jgi:hypothetical protein
MNTVRRRFAAVLCLVLATATVSAADPVPRAATAKAGRTVRLLVIGNSFSNDATAFLDDLAAADGNTLVQKNASIGGSPLQLHWDKAQLHEREPKNPEGLYSGGRGLRQMLLDGPHDFVTIQQRSWSSHDAATFRPYAANLRDYVKRHAPQAELLLHETWAYRIDDPRFSVASAPEGEPRTQRAMYEGLAAAYRTIAGELGVRRIPVGDAFFAADTDPQRGYRPDPKFDPKAAVAPALPDQSRSLHVGYLWSKKTDGAATLGMDGHHASTAGRYLGACVWYEVLFGTTCVGNSFTAGLDADYARFLQDTAHAAVAKAGDKSK